MGALMNNRKAWMKALKSIKFNRDGTMTTETARNQKKANTKETLHNEFEFLMAAQRAGKSFKEYSRANGFRFIGDL